MAKVLSYLNWEDDNDVSKYNKLFPKRLRCVIAGPSNSGKTQPVVNMILQEWLHFDNLYIVSKSLYQTLYQVVIKGITAGLSMKDIISIF